MRAATRRRGICRRPCGGYTVSIRRRRIYVHCDVCGESGPFTESDARRLARRLAGILGRFETPAPRPERARLADLLRTSANVLGSYRFADRARARRRLEARS